MIDEIDPEKFTKEIYGCDPQDIGATVILTPLGKLFEGLKRKVSDLREFKGFLNVFTARHKRKTLSVIRISVGSPIASDATYFLKITQCKNIIYTGSIGALDKNIKVGDIIMPTAAVRGEGASKYHAEEWYPAVASFRVLRKAATIAEKRFSKLGVNVHYGLIYTTDSFAAETRDFLQKLEKRNIIGIEMETSAIFTIANLQGMNAVAIHVVSDNPIVGKSLVEPLPPEDTERKNTSAEALPEVILQIVAEI